MLKKITVIVIALVVSLIFVNVFSMVSEAQSSRYTPDEKIPGTHWCIANGSKMVL